MDRSERIASLENEVEAQILETELTARQIPHVVRSYHDSALDGLFQFSQGWGHVEGPAEFKDEILAVLQELRRGNQPETQGKA
jgi:hypothetical protein